MYFFYLKIKTLLKGKRFNMLIIPIILCSYTFAQNQKEQLIIEVLNKATDFKQIRPALAIVQQEPNLYMFVPSLCPINPKDKPIKTSSFGRRKDPINKTQKFHSGIDMKAKFAAFIYATAAGTIKFAGVKNGYGNCIIIVHKFGFETLYAHLTAFYCKVGQEVSKGQIIAFLGNTGRTTGAHLHYEIHKNNKVINPSNFFKI